VSLFVGKIKKKRGGFEVNDNETPVFESFPVGGGWFAQTAGGAGGLVVYVFCADTASPFR